MIAHDAIELAKLTPTSGWGTLGDPALFKLGLTKAELEARINRAYRQLQEAGSTARQPSETSQQWADRLGDNTLFHTIRVAYLNLEALS
jgi:hypothetical protein